MPEIFTDEYLPPDKREKIRGIINSALESTLKEFKEDFIDTLYVRRNPFTHYKQRKTFRQPNTRFSKEYLPEDWRLKCENIYYISDEKRKINTDKLNKIPINGIGFYLNYLDPEDNKTYCLNIYEIGSRIENNDITNPYTNKPLPIDFIEKIKRLNKTKKKEDIIEEEKIPEKIHIGHLAPGLLEIIRNDINRIIELKSSIAKIDSGPQEDEYNKRMLYLNDEVDEILKQDGYSSGGEDYFNDNEEGEIEEFLKHNDGHHDNTHYEEENNEYQDGHHDNTHYEEEENNEYQDGHHDDAENDDKHHDDDEENDVKYDVEENDNKHDDDEENDVKYDEEEENNEYQDGHHDDEEEQDGFDDDDDYTIDDTDDDSVIAVSDVEYDLDSIIPEICKHCSNDIVDKIYKSILWNGKGIDNVAFCSIKCIENFDWKKYKCKIKKKKNL
jgi:hypothetical protein